MSKFGLKSSAAIMSGTSSGSGTLEAAPLAVFFFFEGGIATLREPKSRLGQLPRVELIVHVERSRGNV